MLRARPDSPFRDTFGRGVGKTTLCSLIPRFYDATEGDILIDGRNVKEIRLQSLRQNIGIVQRDIYLFAGKVAENLRYGKPDASLDEIIEAAKLPHVHDFIHGAAERLRHGDRRTRR
jgi:ATP-binding cassette, subfamily B, bacterial